MSTPITNLTALNDQLNAAAAEARHVLGRIAHTGAGQTTTITGRGWFTEQAETLIAALGNGTGRACPHLGPAPAVIHAAAWAPGQVVCPACTPALHPTPKEDSTCDRCRRPVRRLYPGAAAFGPLILAYGLCARCLPEVGITPPRQHPRPGTAPSRRRRSPARTRSR